MTTNNTIETNPLRVLRNAARYLEANGWIQGARFDLSDQYKDPAACAFGAIERVVTGDWAALVYRDTPTEYADQVTTVLAACEILARYLRQAGYPTGTGTGNWYGPAVVGVVVVWNDYYTRTTDEVCTALRWAADEYESHHGEVTQ